MGVEPRGVAPVWPHGRDSLARDQVGAPSRGGSFRVPRTAQQEVGEAVTVHVSSRYGIPAQLLSSRTKKRIPGAPVALQNRAGLCAVQPLAGYDLDRARGGSVLVFPRDSNQEVVTAAAVHVSRPRDPFSEPVGFFAVDDHAGGRQGE